MPTEGGKALRSNSRSCFAGSLVHLYRKKRCQENLKRGQKVLSKSRSCYLHRKKRWQKNARRQGITVKFTQLFCWQPRAPTQNEMVPGKLKEGAKITVKFTQLFCWQPRAPTHKKKVAEKRKEARHYGQIHAVVLLAASCTYTERNGARRT